MDSFAVGDRVVRRGTTKPVGAIVRIIPAVEYPYYAAHKALAYVRWPDRGRIGSDRTGHHSTLQLARLEHAQQIADHRHDANMGGALIDSYRGW